MLFQKARSLDVSVPKRGSATYRERLQGPACFNFRTRNMAQAIFHDTQGPRVKATDCLLVVVLVQKSSKDGTAQHSACSQEPVVLA